MYVEHAALLRLLGDPTRLRLVRALGAESLNVSELTAVLGVAQSGVSRHLGLLREAGLVTEDRTGAFAWYRLSDAYREGRDLTALRTWLEEAFRQATAATRADDARLEEVRRIRKESFSAHALAGEERRQLVPGRSWAAWSRALGLLLPPLDVADVGCGEGYLTIEAARWARKVVAIDRSADMLARARALASRKRVGNITWKRGTIERLPLGPASVDLVLLSQALHHAADPARALAEAARVLRPGGRVLILDLRAHAEAWVTMRLGDRWLGFSDSRLRSLLSGAGFQEVAVRSGARRADDPFAVLIARGLKARARSS
jgi:ArsR family transcriptional regulator